jgi:hypothetical protein
MVGYKNIYIKEKERYTYSYASVTFDQYIWKMWRKSEPDLFINFLKGMRATYFNNVTKLAKTKLICERDLNLIFFSYTWVNAFEIHISPPPRGAFWVMLTGSQIVFTKNRLLDHTLY